MTEVRKGVTLHPETVAKAEILAKEATKRRRAAKPKPVKSEVKRRYTKKPPSVNPQVWKKALELAGNKPKRIVVESDECVVVLNHE